MIDEIVEPNLLLSASKQGICNCETDRSCDSHSTASWLRSYSGFARRFALGCALKPFAHTPLERSRVLLMDVRSRQKAALKSLGQGNIYGGIIGLLSLPRAAYQSRFMARVNFATGKVFSTSSFSSQARRASRIP